jgi:hypothetical protein
MAQSITLISILVQLTCLAPIFFGWKIDDRDFMVSHVVEDEVLKSFHLIGIAISIPLLLESVCDQFFWVLRREIMISRLAIVFTLFWTSLIMYNTQYHEYNAEIFLCCHFIRNQQINFTFCGAVMYQDMTLKIKYLSFIGSITSCAYCVGRVFMVTASSPQNCIMATAILFFLMLATFIALIFFLMKWFYSNISKLDSTLIYVLACFVIFVFCFISKILNNLYLTQKGNSQMSSYSIEYYDINTWCWMYAVDIIYIVCAAVIPGRIAGHDAMITKVCILYTNALF